MSALPRTQLRRLLRAGCNVAEIAFAYEWDEDALSRRVRHLAIAARRNNYRRVLRRAHGKQLSALAT